MKKLTKKAAYAKTIEINETKEYVGIYVHIPFCKSKCYYCNFNSFVINPKTENDIHNNYVKAVIKEIESYKEKLKNHKVNTIFIGGGTPSILTGNGIEKILLAIKTNFNVINTCEITLEINPNAFNKEHAINWKEIGINRVSVGLQTANEKVLNVIGRTHSKSDFITTMQTLKSAGFNNINCDLMLGLPTQKIADVKKAFKLALKCGATHVSAYMLILEDETPLNKLVQAGKLTLPTEEYTVKMYDTIYKLAKKHNFNRYEVSNFSLLGYECKHNLNCWNMFSYVGFGAGAHSFFNNVRFNNIKSLHGYINEINAKDSAIEESELIDSQELYEETILLGLRTQNGVNLSNLQEKFSVNILQTEKEKIANFVKLQLIEIKDGYLKLKEQGYYVLNKIILELLT